MASDDVLLEGTAVLPMADVTPNHVECNTLSRTGILFRELSIVVRQREPYLQMPMLLPIYV